MNTGIKHEHEPLYEVPPIDKDFDPKYKIVYVRDKEGRIIEIRKDLVLDTSNNQNALFIIIIAIVILLMMIHLNSLDQTNPIPEPTKTSSSS